MDERKHKNEFQERKLEGVVLIHSVEGRDRWRDPYAL
jgi:hypothetical protein